MARMFDTEFDYREETYTATVVISGSDEDRTICVRVPEALENIVPERKIIVEHYNEMQSPAQGRSKGGSSKDPALVESILAAVEKHEEAEGPAGNLWS